MIIQFTLTEDQKEQAARELDIKILLNVVAGKISVDHSNNEKLFNLAQDIFSIVKDN